MGTRTDRRVDGLEKNIDNDKCGRRWGAAARTSEDSGVLGCQCSIDVHQDGLLRPESPALSISSGGHSPDMWPQPPTTIPPVLSRPTTDSESSMEAHQNRKLKWMSLMLSSPAS